MSKIDKLIKKILNGNSDISPKDACKILEMLGYVASGPRGGSSHYTFRKGSEPSITIVLTQNPLKPYIIEKLQIALRKAGYYD